MFFFQPGNGYGGSPNQSVNWGRGGPRMAPIGMRQRQDGPGGFNKDNRVLYNKNSCFMIISCYLIYRFINY